MKNKNLLSYLLIILIFSANIYSQENKSVHQKTEKKSGAEINYIDKLKEGNLRFYKSKMAPKNFVIQREELAKGQHPHTIVVTCSDSRVAPEYIFDGGLGELFVIRTAGNVVDSVCLGSIEYGAEHLKAKQIVVMGHSACGAVTAALNGKTESPYINSILNYIFPSVDKVKLNVLSQKDWLISTIEENAKQQIENIMQSSIITELFHKGELKIYFAVYSIENGFVRFYERASEVKGNNQK